MLQFGTSVNLLQSRRDGWQWCGVGHVVCFGFSREWSRALGKLLRFLPKSSGRRCCQDGASLVETTVVNRHEQRE